MEIFNKLHTASSNAALKGKSLFIENMDENISVARLVEVFPAETVGVSSFLFDMSCITVN